MGNSKGLLLAVTAVALAGCQGFPGLARHSAEPLETSADATSYFVQLIEDGRRHLRANRPTRAITSFRQASYHPSYAGVAYNGMAVGYEMMGRSDVARRYFLAAIEADPADPRFHRNLARLDGTATGTAFAEVEQQPAAELAGEAEDPLATVADLAVSRSVDSAEHLPTRLQRVSSREVMIASRDEWGPRLVAGQAERPAVFHIDQRGRTNPVVNAERERTYPVQFAVAAIAEQSDEADRPAEDESQFQTSEGRVFVRVSGELQRRTVSTYPISFNLGRN